MAVYNEIFRLNNVAPEFLFLPHYDSFFERRCKKIYADLSEKWILIKITTDCEQTMWFGTSRKLVLPDELFIHNDNLKHNPKIPLKYKKDDTVITVFHGSEWDGKTFVLPNGNTFTLPESHCRGHWTDEGEWESTDYYLIKCEKYQVWKQKN